MNSLNGRGWKMTLAALLALLLAIPGWAMLPDEPPPPEPKPAPKAAPKPHPKPQPKPQPKPRPKPQPKPAPAVETGDPVPAVSSNQRFTDNRNGTVTDRRTGLIWLKDANCFGRQGWSTAMASASSLSSGTCGLSDRSVAGQWRLPSKEEWEPLIDKGAPDPPLPAGHPFTGVQSAIYWSSTSDVPNPGKVWYVFLYNGGGVNDDTKSDDPRFYRYVWPVRGGR